MEIPNVKMSHQSRIFSDLSKILEDRISVIKSSEGSGDGGEIAMFYGHLLERLDFQEYESIKSEFLTESKAQDYSNMLKYFDHSYWFESKIDIIRKLNLQSSPTLDILDIGTGVGHFPVLARYFGHNVWGANLPRKMLRPTDGERHFYHVMCDYFDLSCFELAISPNEAISGIDKRFDLITCLMTEFNTIAGNPWSEKEWRFFIDDVKNSILKPGGRLFLQLTNGKLTHDSWSFLKSISEWSEDDQKYALISC